MIDSTLTVADVMSVDPVVIRADASLEEAEELLRSYHIHGLPVVDENGALVGVISQTDLLWRAAPRRGPRRSPRPPGSWPTSASIGW
jgi:CBS-domain-containing membrane protein